MEIPKPYYKSIVKNAVIFYSNVSKNIDKFVLQLLATEVITMSEKRKLMALVDEPGSICDTLLELLDKRPDENSKNVIEALKSSENTHVAEAILKTYQELTSGSSSSTSSTFAAMLESPVAPAPDYQSASGQSELQKEKFPIRIQHAKQVVRILESDEKFIYRWDQVYNELPGTKPSEIVHFADLVKLNTVQNYNIAFKVISDWISKNGKLATVEVLYNALNRVGLVSTADDLLEKVQVWKGE